MTQKIFGLSIGATGIVGTLIVGGILVIWSKAAPEIGRFAISAGVAIGVILGILGIISVAKKVMR